MPEENGGGVFVSSEFDIFVHKPIQTSVLETIYTVCKPLAPVDQSDLEFVVPAENDTYIDTDFKIYIRGKLVSGDGKDLDNKDFKAVTNNFLHSVFSQCSITLNGVPITQASELYQYRSYLETLLTYGSDKTTSHLTNAFWYVDDGDMLPCEPTAEKTATTKKCFITRWDRIKQSKEVQLYGRLHSYYCNVPLYLLPGVRIEIKLTKTGPSFYLMNKTADSKTHFKFLDAQLIVKRVKPHPDILLAHHTALERDFSQDITSRQSNSSLSHSLADHNPYRSITPYWDRSRNVSCSP